jgi:hypothetical protein
VATATETILTVGTDTGTANYFLVAPTGGQIYGATSGLDVNGNQSITDRSQYIYGLPSGESNDQFSTSSWDGRLFKLRVAGIGNAGANAGQTLQVNLYQGTSATIGSDTKIGTTGTGLAAVAGGAFNFYIEALLQWDATSQILSGSYSSNIAFAATSQFTTPTVITNVCTSVTAANLSFLATLKLGNAASSTLTLREFVLDRI